MKAFTPSSVFVAATLLGALTVLPLGAGAAPIIGAVSADRPSTIQLAAMGDLPTVPQQRRRGGRRAAGKDKPYQPLSKGSAGESASAHKEYLKKYGF